MDEGDIVKRHGDHLVILRRGRLFTVDVRRGRLRPIAAVDAFGPGIDPGYAWYDELLIAGDKVVVIGYSYSRGGTEVGVFHISAAGRLRHLGTYDLRSNDYYSSRNYASRLIGTRLAFYSPLYILGDTANPLAMLPAMRQWRPDTDSRDADSRDRRGFRPIATARRIYRPAGRVDLASLETLRTVTSCDLAAPQLACESTVIFGGAARVFYVSPTSVYVSATAWRREALQPEDGNRRAEPRPSVLYRMPLDGGPPAALHIVGSPIDQFSFLEQDEHLDVLLRRAGHGDGMWSADRLRARGRPSARRADRGGAARELRTARERARRRRSMTGQGTSSVPLAESSSDVTDWPCLTEPRTSAAVTPTRPSLRVSDEAILSGARATVWSRIAAPLSVSDDTDVSGPGSGSTGTVARRSSTIGR